MHLARSSKQYVERFDKYCSDFMKSGTLGLVIGLEQILNMKWRLESEWLCQTGPCFPQCDGTCYGESLGRSLQTETTTSQELAAEGQRFRQQGKLCREP